MTCLPIERGGLGLRMIEDFNVALLSKWKWKILEENDALWYKVLKARHEDEKVRVMNGGGRNIGRSFNFAWWKDILALDKYSPVNFFSRGCCIRVGNGFESTFWHAWWTDEGILKELFPVIFYFSSL